MDWRSHFWIWIDGGLGPPAPAGSRGRAPGLPWLRWLLANFARKWRSENMAGRRRRGHRLYFSGLAFGIALALGPPRAGYGRLGANVLLRIGGDHGNRRDENLLGS